VSVALDKTTMRFSNVTGYVSGCTCPFTSFIKTNDSRTRINSVGNFHLTGPVRSSFQLLLLYTFFTRIINTSFLPEHPRPFTSPLRASLNLSCVKGRVLRKRLHVSSDYLILCLLTFLLKHDGRNGIIIFNWLYDKLQESISLLLR